MNDTDRSRPAAFVIQIDRQWLRWTRNDLLR
jgi:hypothetical protein